MRLFANSVYEQRFFVGSAVAFTGLALVLKIRPYPVNRQLILSIIWLFKLTGAESDTTCLL